MRYCALYFLIMHWLLHGLGINANHFYTFSCETQEGWDDQIPPHQSTLLACAGVLMNLCLAIPFREPSAFLPPPSFWGLTSLVNLSSPRRAVLWYMTWYHNMPCEAWQPVCHRSVHAGHSVKNHTKSEFLSPRTPSPKSIPKHCIHPRKLLSCTQKEQPAETKREKGCEIPPLGGSVQQ